MSGARAPVSTRSLVGNSDPDVLWVHQRSLHTLLLPARASSCRACPNEHQCCSDRQQSLHGTWMYFHRVAQVDGTAATEELMPVSPRTK